MPAANPQPMLRRFGAVLLTPVVLAAAILTSVALEPGAAAEVADRGAPAMKYVGRWNYDHPNLTTGTNIAESDLPGREAVPQVGDLVLTADGANHLIGRTNVGCTWRFRATAQRLEPEPAHQVCHNPTSNVTYTINSWTLDVKGDHAAEHLTATSHHQRDYSFKVESGARTRVQEYDPKATAPLVGAWTYDPADPTSGTNIRTSVVISPDGTRTLERSPEQGTITIRTEYGHRLTAITDNGCTWSLVARGNLAMLDPAIQSCTLGDSSLTMRFWDISTAGVHQASTMTGTDERGRNFNLSIGSLHKD